MPGAAYVALVSRVILSFLLFIGLVLAPMALPDKSQAMAMAGADGTAVSHHETGIKAVHPCSDGQVPVDRQAPSKDEAPANCCVMTCVAIPALGASLADQALPAQIRLRLPRQSDPRGLAPEADPPPPRFS